MPSSPNPIDLATLQACKEWIGITGNAGDVRIQGCLTAWSLDFLRATGRGPRNWQTATESPFNQPVNYAEVYDGNGNDRLFLRNFPISAVSSLSVYGSAIAAQGTPGGSGYLIDNSGRCIVLFQNLIGWGGGVAMYQNGPSFARGARGGFPYGAQVVNVNYTAGFNINQVAKQLYTIPSAWAPNTAYATGATVSDGTYLQVALSSGTSGAVAPSWASQANSPTSDGDQPGLIWNNTGISTAPNTISVQSNTVFLADNGVLYFSNGVALTAVQTSPSVGEYYLVGPGTYLFNASDAGREVQISYDCGGTPQDIIQASLEAVSLNYKRRDWEGVSSLSMKDVGQTTYTQFAMSSSVRDVVQFYTRRSIAA